MSDQGFFMPLVGGYSISRGADGMYNVSAKDGRYGAKRMNRVEFDRFIQEQRQNGNVEQSRAGSFLTNTGLGLGLALAADFIFAKGRNTKSIINQISGKSKLKNIAKWRVDNHVVKRPKVSIDDIMDFVNKFTTQNPSIDSLNLIRANSVKQAVPYVKDTALCLTNDQGKILRIFDTNTVLQDVKSLFKYEDVVKINLKA